jgi:hypothetical protein
MDKLLARRLESDKDFKAKMVKLAKDYLKFGRDFRTQRLWRQGVGVLV